MEYRQLGDSDLEVPEICLGNWLTHGGGAVAREQAEAVVNRAFDLGITFFDTANIYGKGAAESFLGEVLAGRPRSSYTLATKVRFAMTETDKGLSADQIRKQSEASLKRLGTDHVDLYQCHAWDDDTPIEETMQALTDVVESGKARYVGFSNWTPAQLQSALDVPGVVRFVSSQPPYSMLRREAETLFPLCTAHGIGQIVYSPLAQGVLTGKYAPGQPPPAGSRAAGEGAEFMDRYRTDETLEAVQRLRPIADGLGLSMPQLALAWVLRRPEVTSAIVGATRPEQLEGNAAASGVSLDASTLAAIDEAIGPNVIGS